MVSRSILSDGGTFANGLCIHHGIVYLPTSRGIYSTSNNGNEWKVEHVQGGSVTIAGLYADANNIYADTYGQGIFTTNNAAIAWHCIDSTLSDMALLAPSPYYLIVGTTSLFSRKLFSNTVYRTKKEFIKWKRMEVGLTGGYINSIMGSKDMFILCHSNGLYYSQDTGSTWNRIDNINSPYRCLSIRDTLYLLTRTSGIYRSTNGVDWTSFLPPFGSRSHRLQEN
jgi:hypothetical protein